MPDAFTSQFRFSPDNRLCVGVEEEVWTVRRSGVLTPLAPLVFTKGYEKTYPFLRPALPSQQIESITPPCVSMKEVEYALRRNAFELERLAKQHGVLLSRDPVPTKPHSISVFPNQHFREMGKRLGARIGSAYVAGLRVHVGVANADEAVLAMNVLRQHLPSLLILSARSPFVRNGYKYASFRHVQYASTAGAVAPPYLAGWKEFSIAAQRGKFAEDPRQCPWGVRPNPLGTVELRICDVQNSYSRTLELVALTRMLVRGAIEGQLKPEPSITTIALEDWLIQAARGTWRTTPFTSVIVGLSKDPRHREEISYVKRLLP